MQQRRIVIRNRLGLHARAAAKLVRLANSYNSSVSLARVDSGQKIADAKSILGVLMLAAAQNSEVDVMTEGDDEMAAMEALCNLIENKFDEAE
ncbi:MAG TPA: HPr family phosphocarrier protein [Blastocatellia bacterium]|nr:HPr family phosphocarrier protein [Blastocatellia bacterium]